ncbi:MAG: phthiocerol/phthiodiolone dimycocerosyl transferase family protein [Segniliparus sp.]|uniref:phthiocerol/phthiodiolone dimycocerosyl transferase family protein n=1 Tax=Segniliparus sp. TaxID=2804064 RepID=UPI003F2C0F0D
MTNTAHDDEERYVPGAAVRAMSPSEAFWTLGSLGFMGFTVLVSGRLDLEALDQAFVELQRRHETLRAVVRKAVPTPEFVWRPGPPARLQVFEGEDSGAQSTGHEAVFDQTQHVVHLGVIPGEEHTRVTLFLFHALVDGAPALALHTELWSLYTSRVETGGFPPDHIQAFPQPGEHYLNRREYPGASPRQEIAQLPPLQLPDVQARPAPLADRLRLSQADTEALARFTKAEGVSANALISAALIRAHIRAGEPAPVYAFSVDLRERVAPPVGALEATNLVGLAFFDDTEAGPGLVALARKIQDQLAKDLADGTVHQNDAGRALPRLAVQAFDSIVHSASWGRIPPLRLPDGLAALDFQYAGLSDPVAAAATSSSGRLFARYVISWFDGRLRVELTNSRPNSAQLLALVEEELRGAIQAA